jgi:hypothetical protein
MKVMGETSLLPLMLLALFLMTPYPDSRVQIIMPEMLVAELQLKHQKLSSLGVRGARKNPGVSR